MLYPVLCFIIFYKYECSFLFTLKCFLFFSFQYLRVPSICGMITHWKFLVAGVTSILNSATGIPRSATRGANIAAGWTTDDVPTTRHASHVSTASSVNNILFFNIFLQSYKNVRFGKFKKISKFYNFEYHQISETVLFRKTENFQNFTISKTIKIPWISNFMNCQIFLCSNNLNKYKNK